MASTAMATVMVMVMATVMVKREVNTWGLLEIVR